MDKHVDTLARTLYAEARGEYRTIGVVAFIAVANVVMNRLRFPHLFGDSVHDICLKPYQFSCWLEQDPNRSVLKDITLKDPLFQICWTVAEKCVSQQYPDLTQNSDHYHGSALSIPYWAEHCKPKVVLGNHVFYQLQKPLK